MSFYLELSNYYHIIFPPQPAQLQLLNQEFNQAGSGKKVLDVACAIGEYSFALAEKDFVVTGFDLEEKMINLALEKKAKLEQAELEATGAKADVKAEFFVGDMRYSDEFGSDFQGLFCIGNSIAHLTSQEDLQQTANSFFQALNKSGVAVVQVVNFDRIIKYGVDSLPTITKEKASLVRNYVHLDDGLIDFQTILTIHESGKKQEFNNSVHLRPLLKKELEIIFKDAGFSSLNFYGGFNQIEHTDDSPATVLVAKK